MPNVRLQQTYNISNPVVTATIKHCYNDYAFYVVNFSAFTFYPLQSSLPQQQQQQRILYMLLFVVRKTGCYLDNLVIPIRPGAEAIKLFSCSTEREISIAH